MIFNLLKNFRRKTQQESRIDTSPVIIPRSEHTVSRDAISDRALKVLYRLHKAGYQAYLVGGGVRDILLGLHPKDFDVATDAKPEEVKSLFGNCRLIGRRFRLAHVYFGREIIEVATFRASHEQGNGASEGGVSEGGQILRDNVFGTLEDDAWRRDFTINALYYNIADFSLVDYTGGMADLNNRVIRIIGDASTRFQEDPVRMLRAARFAAKLGFHLEDGLDKCIIELADRMANVPAARLFDEVLKIFHTGHALASFDIVRELGLFGYLFGQTNALLESDDPYTEDFLRIALGNTDSRIAGKKPVNPAFLFAAFLWGPVKKRADRLLEQDGMTDLQALQIAGNEVLTAQLKQVSIPKRFSFPMREIWTMQARLPRRNGKRAWRLLEQARFRAAYDFMLVRNQAGEPLQELADWWTEFQEANASERSQLIRKIGGSSPRRRRKPRKAKSASTH